MNKLMISFILFFSASQLAHAAGDPVAGQTKAAVCASCHGPDGNSVAPNYPKIAGQGERYLLKQLHDIQSGKRQGQALAMVAFVANLNDQDLADLAAFYSRQTMTVGAADPAKVEAGQALFRGGKLTEGMPSCIGCHAPSGIGNAAAGFPRLSGQHAQYITQQLTDFREGNRTNDGDTMVMRSIAAKLSNKDIEALSTYIEGLH